MNLEAAMAHLMNVCRHYVYAGIQVSQAYNEAQSTLSLEEILTPTRLDNSEGVRESLAMLDQIKTLTLTHKEAYGQFMVASMRDMNAAIEQLPQPQRDEQRNDTIMSINRQLALQADFYVNRHRWIDAMTELCQLVEARRGSYTFGPEGISFEDDQDADRFDALLEQIDEIHHIEVAAVEERMDSIRRSLATLAG